MGYCDGVCILVAFITTGVAKIYLERAKDGLARVVPEAASRVKARLSDNLSLLKNYDSC